MDEKELLNHPKIRAMLNVIKKAEGADYNTRVGGGKFSDLSKKPGQKVFIKSINDYSSAEGAYQFLNGTWDNVSKKLGLKDFSPYSQDLAAVHLIKQRGAVEDILNDNFEGAINKLSKEWASLPTSRGGSVYKGQKARKLDFLKNVYNSEPEKNSNEDIDTNSNIDINIKNIPTVDFSIPQINGIVFSEDSTPQKEQEQNNNQYQIQQSPEDKLLEESFAESTQQTPLEYSTVDIQPIEYSPISNPLEQYQDGGEVIKRDADWLNNWIANRKIKGQPLPQDFKRVTTDRVYMGEPEDFKGEENTYGYFDPYYGATILNKDKYLLKPNIPTHKFAHQIQDRNPYYKSLIEEPITKLVKPVSYTSQPEEIHSELMRLRQAEGYDPEKEVTKEQVDKIKNLGEYNLKDVNKDQLLELLNSTVSLNSKPGFYAQDGGNIPVTPNGMWEYPKQTVIVPTSGHITMEGIDYPIFATSLETGETKLMKPNKKYFFKNTKNVLETYEKK